MCVETDDLEKAMASHSSTFAWKIPWMEEPGRLQSRGWLELDTTERLHFHFSLSSIGEGNGNPLQCSCLENPRDGGAWWAAIYGSHRVGHDWSNLAAAAAALSFLWIKTAPRKRQSISTFIINQISIPTLSSIQNKTRNSSHHRKSEFTKNR